MISQITSYWNLSNILYKITIVMPKASDSTGCSLDNISSMAVAMSGCQPLHTQTSSHITCMDNKTVQVSLTRAVALPMP
jgi:hypothetical protein